MLKHRRILLILGIGLVIGALWIMFRSPPPPRKITPLGINLVGVTSGSGQTGTVECIVSNSNDRTIWFWPAKPQVKSNGEWPQELIMLPVRYTALQGNETVRFAVSSPTNSHSQTWRVPVFWTLQPSKKEWVSEVINQNVSSQQNGSALPGVRIGWGFTEAWTNYSPEINP